MNIQVLQSQSTTAFEHKFGERGYIDVKSQLYQMYIIKNFFFLYSRPTCVYTLFKKLATEICLTMFLDLDFDSAAETAQEIVALTTTHWHGMF